MFWGGYLNNQSVNFRDRHLKLFLRAAYLVRRNRQLLKKGYIAELTASRGFKQFKRSRAARQATAQVLLNNENENF
jgi:hypothetical protein